MICLKFPLPLWVRVRLRGILTTTGIGLGCSIFILIISSFFSGLFTAWENKTLDYRFKLRGSIPTHSDIVLIDIDDTSMKAIGRWPWDRAYHGKMIDILSKSGVAAIGYDVLFDQPATVEGDNVLINTTAGIKNIHYPVGFGLREGVAEPMGVRDGETSLNVLKRFALPQQISAPKHVLSVERSVAPFKGLLAVSEGLGHISSNRDPDGTIRSVPLIVNLEGSLFPAFGLSVVATYLQVSRDNIIIQPGSHILLRNAKLPGRSSRQEIYIPIDDRGMMVINYAGRWEDTFVHYSFADIMKTVDSNKGDSNIRESLSGKICLVSNTATGYDLKPIPLEENCPGGGIHANIINTILTGNFLREISPVGKFLILSLLSIAAAWLSIGSIVRKDWKLSLLSVIFLIGGYWGFSYFLFYKFGLVIEFFSPSLAIVLSYSTGTLYSRNVEQRRSARLLGEMKQLGRSVKSMSEELITKEGELSNLRNELSTSMSTFNTVMAHDEESINKVVILEAKVESVLKEKDLLLQSKQQLEMKLARILTEPVRSEYQLEGEWEELQKECSGYGIITRSMKLLKIFEQAKKAAKTKSPVLILGESGTGKELFARAIHELSPRSKKPFVVIDTPAMSDTLFESDLFGHVRGAFTGAINDRKGYFEMAQGGTIFLDEIGDMSGRIQAGLFGVLQRYEMKRVGSSAPSKVDVRVIAATNRNISEDIAKGIFREDLYYRLNVVSIELPPLRERMEDIEPLIHYFFGKYCAENGISDSEIKGVTPNVLRRLKAHSWNGNIRELENVIARAVAMAKGKWITEADIGPLQLPSLSTVPSPLAGEGKGGGGFEGAGDAAFLSILDKNDFSIDKTARILVESRGTVAHRLKGICLEQLGRSNGDIYKASLTLSGGNPESLHRVKKKIEEYYSNLISVIQQFQNAEDAMTECRRRFKNLNGRYFTAIEELVKEYFEKNRQI